MATVPTSVGLHDLPTPGGPCEVRRLLELFYLFYVFLTVYLGYLCVSHCI